MDRVQEETGSAHEEAVSVHEGTSSGHEEEGSSHEEEGPDNEETDSRSLDILEAMMVVDQLAYSNYYLAKMHELLLETRDIWQNHSFSRTLNATGLLGSERVKVDDVEKGTRLNAEMALLSGLVAIPFGGPPPLP
jgi:hypothetical protein